MLIGDKFSYPEKYTVLVHDVPVQAAIAWLAAVCPHVTISGYTPKEIAENFHSRWTNKIGVCVAGDDSDYDLEDIGLYNYDGRIQLLKLSNFGDMA